MIQLSVAMVIFVNEHSNVYSKVMQCTYNISRTFLPLVKCF